LGLPSRDCEGAVRYTPSARDNRLLYTRGSANVSTAHIYGFAWAIVETVTKKKLVAETIIAPQILEMAKKSVEAERFVAAKPCAVCGASCTPLTGPSAAGAEQELCWVCRRLKISAWRDADHQLSAQE